jgi:NAD dependent epimerase/dehydratase
MRTFWREKKVLVTGAGGFIGSHLVERLANEGAQVRAFVRYNSRGDIGLLRLLTTDVRSKVEIIGGDLRDLQALQAAVNGCRYIFHLGALISIPYSYRHPREVAETNLIGTLNLLQASRVSQVDRLIHTSTSEVYGTARYAPIDENHPLQGQSPYSASKIGADKLAESFYCAYGLPVVTVRPFNTYGPRQSARAVIPTIITQALAQETIHLGNLETTRDFTYVEDTVAGFLAAAQTEGVEGQTFNLGTGVEIKIGDLVKKIVQQVGSSAEIQIDTNRLRPRTSEVFRLISNNTLAREKLDWQPKLSLDDGLLKTIGWIRSHLDMYQVGKYEF